MIIDLILDRKDREEEEARGVEVYTYVNGRQTPIKYQPAQFYRDCMSYGRIGDDITRAMDYGTEADVKHALKRYVVDNDYNPDVCNYIDSVAWLD